ncbi:MAG: hypothetical protein QOD83_1853, partial [Solirubrobacteraceae bacterium]|nr:hypothetical protein [Solirubrobacteraceae bacterium]
RLRTGKRRHHTAIRRDPPNRRVISDPVDLQLLDQRHHRPLTPNHRNPRRWPAHSATGTIGSAMRAGRDHRRVDIVAAAAPPLQEILFTRPPCCCRRGRDPLGSRRDPGYQIVTQSSGVWDTDSRLDVRYSAFSRGGWPIPISENPELRGRRGPPRCRLTASRPPLPLRRPRPRSAPIEPRVPPSRRWQTRGQGSSAGSPRSVRTDRTPTRSISRTSAPRFTRTDAARGSR